VLPYAMDYAGVIAIGIPFLIVTNVLSNMTRADGKPKYSMVSMVVGAVFNIVLDPIFIFVFNKGVWGAAVATVISQIVSFCIAVAYIPRFQSVKITRASFKFPKWRTIYHIASLGVGNCVTQLAMIALQITLNNSLTYWGELSKYGADIPLSIAGIVMKVNGIVFSVFIGLCQGSQPILGFNYGARQFDRVKKTYKTAIGVSLVASVIAFTCFQLFPDKIINIFGTGDELYMEFGCKFLRTFIFMMIVGGLQPISANMFSAIGKAGKGLLLSLSRTVMLQIPLILILPRFFGIDGIMYAGPCADSAAVCFCLFMVAREFKNMDKLAEMNKE